TRIATLGDEIQVWDATTGALLNTFQTTGAGGSLSEALAWSPDGGLLASSPTRLDVVYLYDTQTWTQNAKCSGQTKEISSVAWAPDGHALASGGGDTTVHIWDRNGQEISTYTGHQDWINEVDWSPSGIRIASASGYDPVGEIDNTVHISEVATGNQ